MNDKVFSNFIWRFAERFGAQGVAFLVSLILARLLNPDVYGTIALVTVFTTILNVFVDSGFGNALIQKKDADDLDFNSVFYFNITACAILYLLIFLAAPIIAKFYSKPELTLIIRVLSLTLVVSGVKNVQQAYVSKNLLFRKFFFSTIGGTVVAAIIGVFMAYKGFGVWALVAQQLINTTIDTTILWFTVKWRPKWMFSFTRLKGLISYGWKLLVSCLIDTLDKDIRQLIIGKFYSTVELAYYNQGNKYPNLLASNINTSIDSVLLPVMSRAQDNRAHVKAMTRRSIKTSIYIMAPMMCGLCAVADILIPLILTDKWTPCIPYFRVFCITFIFYPVHTANLNAIKAVGRSDIFLKLEIIKKIFSMFVLLITVWFGPFVMAASGLVTTWIGQMINAFPNKKLLNYSYKEQFIDMLPTLLMSAAMCMAVWIIGIVSPFGRFFTLVIQIVVGIALYIGESIITKDESFDYILKTVRPLLKSMTRKGK